MGVFIRFVSSPEQAVRDFERGYSYRCYEVYETRESALKSDFVEHHGGDIDDIEGMCDMHTSEFIGYGFRLAGLCGFDYSSRGDTDEYLDDVIADAREHDTLNYRASDFKYIAIYDGEYIEMADGGDGDVFRPKRLVTVISTQE